MTENRYEQYAVTDCGEQETQAHFDARMALGRQRRAAAVAPARNPFRGLPVDDEEAW